MKTISLKQALEAQETLRRQGRDDEQIAAAMRSGSGIDITAEEIGANFADAAGRGTG